MESIKTKVNKDLDKNYLSKKMDKDLMNLINKLDIPEDEVKKNLSSLEDTIFELKNCKKCPGFENCPNHLKGYVSYPSKNESNLTFNYIPCKVYKKNAEEIEKKDSNKILENARMKDIDTTDANRTKLIKWLKKFYDNYDKSKENKGLYLHGTFGSGKTFLIACLLNELKIKKNVKYEIIYFPEMLRNLKDNFSMLDSKVRYYSSVEILVIDDIGAEKVTDWSRDEILGTILQARMNNHLTTFFTSNLNIEELEKHLSITKDSVDAVKSRRVIERVKQLSVDMELISKNLRK